MASGQICGKSTGSEDDGPRHSELAMSMPPLTPEAIKTRFNRAMPERRRKFREAFEDFRDKIFHEHDYPRKYPERLLRLTEAELGVRLEMAEEGVEKLLDSGWRPSLANEIRTVFLTSMGTQDPEEDPTGDLYAAAAKAYSDVGSPDPPDQQTVSYRLADFNRRKSEACIANLETHVVKDNDSPAPTIQPTTPNFSNEFERIKGEFEKLPVKDEANRTRLLNELETVITMALGKDGARYIKQSRGVHFYPQVLFSDGPDYTPRTWREGQLEMTGLIESMKHHLSMIARSEPEASSVARVLPTTNKVFIVHGHDKAMRSDVEAFVNRVGLDAIILMEEANQGRTLLEKFEAHAEASYAVVLLSPDDIGRAASATGAEEKLRPRQNVVLELGYFIGRLGRQRVAAMVDQDRDNQVEYPTDIRGIATVPYSHTNGDWKRLLAKEFRAAKLPFDEDRV